MQIKAGKLMLELINELIHKEKSFGFETTLAGQKWLKLISELKENNYKIHIFFLDLQSVDLAINRVSLRVESGGHNIPLDTIKRGYERSRTNFWNDYKDIADCWYLFDNSASIPELVTQSLSNKIDIIDQKYFDFYLETIN